MWDSLERPWIVVSVNPPWFDQQFSYYGPFLDAEQAMRYVNMHITKEYGWWVTRIEEPIWDR